MSEPDRLISFPKAEEDSSPARRSSQDRSFLFLYAIALFAVAAALIFLSYLSSAQHNRQEEYDAIQAKQADFSVSAMQNIEGLQKENQRLLQEADELKVAIEVLREQIADWEEQAAVFDEGRQTLEREKQAAESRLAVMEATVLMLEEKISVLESADGDA